MDVMIRADEDRLVLERCTACKRFRIAGKWRKLKPRQAVKEILKLATSLSDIRASSWQAIPESEEVFHSKRMPKEVLARIQLYTRNGVYETNIPLRLQNTICPTCNKLRSHYFEGILQLRNATPDLVMMAKQALREAGGVIKEEKTDKQGRTIDWKVTSNKAVIHAARLLARKYLGRLSITSTLHTRDRQTSKEKKRVTATFTKYDFTIGSIIRYQDRAWLIKRREQGSLILKPLPSGRDERVLLREADHFHTYPLEEREIIRVKPHLEVLDDDWQPRRAQPLQQDILFEPGMRVLTVTVDEHIYIPPQQEDSKRPRSVRKRKG